MASVLHYIYDPLCGWCYAAEGLVDAVTQGASERVRIQLNGGGLFNAMRLPATKRAYIREADAHIGRLTGQSFGAPYLDGLLADPETVYDSQPPITAILAAQAVKPGIELTMLKAIQHAHYRDGRRIVEPQILVDVAESIGLARPAFTQAFEDMTGEQTASHLADTRKLMHHVGAHGFPSFVLQTGDRFEPLRHDVHYGKPEGFAALVLNSLDR